LISTQDNASGASCCFCQGPFSDSKRTAEHIIPQWLLRDAGVLETESHSFLSVATDGTSNRRDTPAYSHVYKRVCSSCNSGWLSALEAETKRIVKRMVEEEVFTLDRVDRLFLNAWTYKLFALTHLSEGGLRAQIIRAQDLVSLHKHLLPQGRCFLALAKCSGYRVGKISVHFFQNSFITTREEAEKNDPSETQCFVGMLRVSNLMLLFAYVPPGVDWALELDPRVAESASLWPGPESDEVPVNKTQLPEIEHPERLTFFFIHPGYEMSGTERE